MENPTIPPKNTLCITIVYTYSKTISKSTVDYQTNTIDIIHYKYALQITRYATVQHPEYVGTYYLSTTKGISDLYSFAKKQCLEYLDAQENDFAILINDLLL